MGDRNNIDEQIGGAHQQEDGYASQTTAFCPDGCRPGACVCGRYSVKHNECSLCGFINGEHQPSCQYYSKLRERLKFDHETRKAAPLWSGVMRYFPDALLAVARLSKKANDKHNPGEPLHWSREKSSDHGDCIARHQLNPAEIDPEFDELHATMVAWRALAQLQLLEEARLPQAVA